MKNLLLLLIIILSFGCGDTNTGQPDPPTEPPIVIEPPPEPPDPPNPVYTDKLYLFAFSTAGNSFYDGVDWIPTTYEKRARSVVYMFGDEIYTLDEFGNAIDSIFAPEAGEIIKATTNGFILCDIMPETESFNLGAMFAVYSQIHHFSNGSWTEPNPWVNNKWQCDKIVETASGDLAVIDTLGAYRSLGAAVVIFAANEGGLLIHNYDGVGRSANFTTDLGTTLEVWATNYLGRARDWQKINGIYYSHNGYEYSNATGLVLSANAMTVWNNPPNINNPYPIAGWTFGENPTLVPIGVYGQSILWIECNTGWIIEHRTGTNQIIVDKRIFIGGGTQADGLLDKATLNPILVGDFAYMTYGGSVLEVDLITGAVRVMLANNAVVEVF